MVVFRPLYCFLLAALVSTLTSLPCIAQQNPTRNPRTTEIVRGHSPADSPTPERELAGNPVMGVLIIILMVGFLILAAWIFSRVGHGHSRPSDNTLD